MNKINYFFFFFLASLTIVSQTTFNISDPEELTALSLEAGDIVILADGTYDSDARIKFLGTGTAAAPITFRPQTPGGVVFNGGLKISIGGDFLVVDGFHWKGGYGASNFIEFRNSSIYANNSTIQNCAIDGLQVDPDDETAGTSVKHRWIVLYGTYNTVINCSFMNKPSAGALVLVELEYNASPDDEVTNTRCNEVGHTISNNYFYKYAKIDNTLSNSGDSETIRVGTSEFQNVNSRTTVSNNYFVEADGENEIITNKSANNIYTNNTFRRCRGSLVLRHGANATVDGNYFLGENVDGTGGIRIVDSNHSITNNYIQDCITVVDQAKWNNGITFLGGGDSNAVVCTSTNVSNGYQKAENITLANNTIINTNAPLFYNIDKGSNDVTGTVMNNLIYFDTSSPNITPVISGDTAPSFSSLGTALTYTGNVYNGTTLGETTTGFTEETGIATTSNGEVFNFSGADGKGADMGTYEPVTDAMVGDGIGACFLNYLGVTITNPVCTIEVVDALSVSSLSAFTAEAGNSEVFVNANVNWNAVSNDNWISIDINSGTANATVVVSVTENEDFVSRNGSITFTQVGGDITRTVNVSQNGAEAPDPRLDFILINDESENDNVTVAYVFAEEVTDTKNNVAANSLDKDFDTQWSGEGVPGEIIYNLGGAFDLALVDFATTSGKTYEFQIWVSTTGIEESDFTNAFPNEGNDDGNLTSNSTGEFELFTLPVVMEDVKYVKIIGYGQPARPSDWNTIKEIEFYKEDSSLSVEDNDLTNMLMYPIPAKELLYVKNLNTDISKVEIINLEGKILVSHKVDNTTQNLTIDTSSIGNGLYLVKVSSTKNYSKSKMIIVQH